MQRVSKTNKNYNAKLQSATKNAWKKSDGCPKPRFIHTNLYT